MGPGLTLKRQRLRDIERVGLLPIVDIRRSKAEQQG